MPTTKTLPVWFGVLLMCCGCTSGGDSIPHASPVRPVNAPNVNESSAPVPTSTASQSSNPSTDVPASTPVRPQLATSRANAVIWKRYAALEADLMRALELNRDELCKEFGDRSCTRDVHTIALGGNDPFRSGINRPPSEPSGTTPIAVDRILLSACSTRARADAAGPAKVFTSLDLRGPAPSPEAAAAATTIRDLYRRLLSRDPKDYETNAIEQLLDRSEPDSPKSGEEFATLACYVIGSSVEFLFD